MTDPAPSPARKHLDRAHNSIRELVALWHDAPQRAKWLIIGIDGDITGAIAEIDAPRIPTHIA